MLSNTEFKKFREDFKGAVKGLEEKYGVSILPKNITYTENSFNMKVEVVRGSFEEKMKDDFNKFCSLYNLKETDYGKKITIDDTEYEIVGIDRHKRKYCIKVKSVRNGETYGVPQSECLKALGR